MTELEKQSNSREPKAESNPNWEKHRRTAITFLLYGAALCLPGSQIPADAAAPSACGAQPV